MPDSGQVSGSVFLRPVRVGHVFKPSLDALLRAIENATCSWGGVHHAMLSADQSDSEGLARSLGVDVLHPADDYHLSKRLAEKPGFNWTGWHGPFEVSDSPLQARLLDASWLMAEAGGVLRLPNWSDEDHLSALFAAWFGRYPDSEVGRGLHEGFLARGYEAPLDIAKPIEMSDDLTPIGLTKLEVTHQTDDAAIGIIALDAGSPADLMQFWNLRSLGSDVFPWATGFEARLLPAAESWLDAMSSTGRIPAPRSGDGHELSPTLRVWQGESLAKIPEDLVGLVESKGISVWLDVFHRPRQWRGSHPLEPETSRSFTATVDNTTHSFGFGLPRFRDMYGQRFRSTGVVAAQISIDSETSTGPGWSTIVPNFRDLSPVLSRFASLGQPFTYATHDGRALGVSNDAETASINLVASMKMFEWLFRDSGWTCTQSDSGRFATRLIELLGGPSTEVANQPAVREILGKAARSATGLKLPALIGAAEQTRGTWPGGLMVLNEEDYPNQVVRYLLARKILHPVLPVRCPSCATVSILRPEELETEVSCVLCSERLPLGLALGLKARRTEWHYRLAPNVPQQRLAEALPVMASLNVVSSASSEFSPAAPHVLGLELKGPELSCEIDIALGANDRGPPAFVLGEVKSFRDEIDLHDLTNLETVARYLRNRGLDCYVLVATLREALRPEVIKGLRARCERCGSSESRLNLEPLLPIVLTERDLSVPRFSDNHLTSSRGRGFGLAALAFESCHRNLGLVDIQGWPQQDGEGWRFRWTDAGLPGNEDGPEK